MIELATTIAAALRSGTSSDPVARAALAEGFRHRIAAFDGAVHSFVHLATPGEPNRRSGPLAGIPVAAKDVFDVASMPTTGNSRLFRGRPAPTIDAPSVRSLRLAGAEILGKLANWECGVGGTSFGLPWPPARNPWDLSRDPGGSSTGAGAALAAGFCLGALGTDTGGSVREPASWCGVAGLKPTYGLVPTDGVIPASTTLDHVGPMARTAEDCALLLDALLDRGPDHSFTRTIGADPAGLRIGAVSVDGEACLDLDAEIANGFEATLRRLAVAGCAVHPVRLPPLIDYSAVVTVQASLEGLALFRRAVEDQPEMLDPLTWQRLKVGALVSAADYAAAQSLRDCLAAATLEAAADVDVLVMPTTRTTAPPLGGFDSHAGHPSLTRPWNVVGWPALSVRAGFDRKGLPFGLQIIGRPHAEALVFQLGRAIERGTGNNDHWPDMAQVASRRRPDRIEEPPLSYAIPATLEAVVRRAIDIVHGSR